MSADAWEIITQQRAVREHAADRPDDVAVVWARADGSEQTVDWRDLASMSERFAGALRARGVGPDDMVALVLPNRPEHLAGTIGAWTLGACVVPLNASAPKTELARLLDLAQPRVVVRADPTGDPRDLALADVDARTVHMSVPEADVIPHPARAVASGGSTGNPKLIVDPTPWAFPRGFHPYAAVFGLTGPEVTLLPGPLYHTQGFMVSHVALFQGHRVVLMERFDAARALELIERERVTFASIVPTMMARMARLAQWSYADLSSFKLVMHSAGPCPGWVKRSWIEKLGPEKVWETYTATERVGTTLIGGEEWLAHPGSVGRGAMTEIRILSPDRRVLPPGEVGEVFMRNLGEAQTFRYLGADAPTAEDGFSSVGDLGWLDADGYLYLADRRVDLIVTGGHNVYPAEVESVLGEHPGVRDVVVIGLPNDELGRIVHGLVEPAEDADPPTFEELDRFCRERLSAYKCPRSYEIVARLPRDDAGKIRRGTLAGERSGDTEETRRP